MKLQQQRSMGGQNPVDKGDFFSRKKEEFLMEQQNKGWDMFERLLLKLLWLEQLIELLL